MSMQPLSHWLKDALDKPIGRIPTGFPDLDTATGGGFVPGTLMVLAALTGCGKSTIALNILATMAANGTPCALVTLEDTARIVATKLLSLWSGVELKSVFNGTMTTEERNAVDEARRQLEKLPLQISETHDVNALRLEISHVAAQGAKFVVVDQLHHLTINPPPHNKYERISAATRELQTIATVNDVALLVLHQLNRKSNDEGVALHHLRDSGTIEQDARLVLLVTHCERDHDATKPAVLTVQIAKNSHGAKDAEFKLVARFDTARVESYVGARE